MNWDRKKAIRALVFSDSHGNVQNLSSVLDQNIGAADYVFHLGDIERDLEYLQKTYPMFKIEGVCGNNEWHAQGVYDLLLTVGEHCLFLTHGHRYAVKSGEENLIAHAKSLGADVILYGHTHRPVCRYEDDILILNPGSISRPYAGSPTFGTLDFVGDKVVGNIFEL